MRIVLDMLNVARGGGLSVLMGLLEAWSRLAPDIEPIVLVTRREVKEQLAQRGWSDSVREIDAPGTLATYWFRKTKFRSLLRDLKPDVVMSNNGPVSGADYPQVVHHQTLWSLFAPGLLPYAKEGPRRLLLTLAARRALAKADANTYISQYMRDCAERINPASRNRNHVCYNGIDPLYMAVASDPAVRSSLSADISAVSFPSTHKDNETLLLSMTELKRLAPSENWRLRIIGWGDWTPIEQRVQQLGLDQSVEFLGFCSPQRMIDVFRSSLCMVYPSYFEGFGMPVVEAMACGCPVVAVNATAIPEIAGNAAILVEPRSTQQVAEAVRSLHQDESRRCDMIQRGKKRALDFPWEKTAVKFIDLFRSLAR